MDAAVEPSIVRSVMLVWRERAIDRGERRGVREYLYWPIDFESWAYVIFFCPANYCRGIV
jgi:hypothetical protein